jgi:hypothetical protein
MTRQYLIHPQPCMRICHQRRMKYRGGPSTATVQRWLPYYIQWGMLQRTVFLMNKVGLLQRTRRNTISRRSTRMRMTCRAFPL